MVSNAINLLNNLSLTVWPHSSAGNVTQQCIRWIFSGSEGSFKSDWFDSRSSFRVWMFKILIFSESKEILSQVWRYSSISQWKYGTLCIQWFTMRKMLFNHNRLQIDISSSVNLLHYLTKQVLFVLSNSLYLMKLTLVRLEKTKLTLTVFHKLTF